MSSPGAEGRDGSASPSDRRPTHRFPRDCRLTARREFVLVHETGRRVSSSSFTLLGRPSAAPTTRIGLTVTRKIGGAAVRNRIKRMLREVFRYNRSALVPPLDLVVLARPGIQERTVAQLESEFLKRFEELARRLVR